MAAGFVSSTDDPLDVSVGSISLGSPWDPSDGSVWAPTKAGAERDAAGSGGAGSGSAGGCQMTLLPPEFGAGRGTEGAPVTAWNIDS